MTLHVDGIITSGPAGLETTTPGTLPIGTFTDSYYIHFDPVSEPTGSVIITAWLESFYPFAVIYSDPLLDASDSILGKHDITYPTGVSGRGLESDVTHIQILSSPPDYPSARTSFDWSESGDGLDGMRIIFLPGYPEPATLGLLAVGAGAMMMRHNVKR